MNKTENIDIFIKISDEFKNKNLIEIYNEGDMLLEELGVLTFLNSYSTTKEGIYNNTNSDLEINEMYSKGWIDFDEENTLKYEKNDFSFINKNIQNLDISMDKKICLGLINRLYIYNDEEMTEEIATETRLHEDLVCDATLDFPAPMEEILEAEGLLIKTTSEEPDFYGAYLKFYSLRKDLIDFFAK